MMSLCVGEARKASTFVGMWNEEMREQPRLQCSWLGVASWLSSYRNGLAWRYRGVGWAGASPVGDVCRTVSWLSMEWITCLASVNYEPFSTLLLN